MHGWWPTFQRAFLKPWGPVRKLDQKRVFHKAGLQQHVKVWWQNHLQETRTVQPLAWNISLRTKRQQIVNDAIWTAPTQENLGNRLSLQPRGFKPLSLSPEDRTWGQRWFASLCGCVVLGTTPSPFLQWYNKYCILSHSTSGARKTCLISWGQF